jgi:DNA topoisomerase-1
MKLVIVESPAKCQKIQGYLGSGWKVIASMGHIRGLEPSLDSIGIAKDFEPTYNFIKEKAKAIKQIKEEASKADEIYLAADGDREGNAIAYSVALLLKLNPKTAKRMIFHEITEKAIKHAAANTTNLDMNMVYSQQTRAMLDMLIGFTLSPILWKCVAPSLSAGRCQSPSLRIVVEREDEIKSFKPSSGWQLVTEWKAKDGFKFSAKMEDELEDEESTKNYLENIHQVNTGTIISKEVKEWYENPPDPLITTTLQQQSSAMYRIAPKQTMRIAQKLYEKGFITYMRSDSIFMSEDAQKNAKSEIKELYGEEYINTSVVQIKKQAKKKDKDKDDGPKAQEAHECIRPTDFSIKSLPDDEEWSGQERKVYQLIWQRAIQSVMSQAKGLSTTIKTQIEDDDFLWKSQWKNTTFEGWKKAGKVAQIDDTDSEDDGEKEKEKDKEWQLIQKLKEGDKLQWLNIKAEPKNSKAPPRFTEATLVRELEKYGIGRPSTYASLLDTIQEKKYVEIKDIPAKEVQITEYSIKPNEWPPTENSLKKKVGAEKSKLVPTELGRSVLQFLLKHFNDLFELSFTAQMEKRLDLIAEGKEHWKQSLKDIWESYKDRYDSFMSAPSTSIHGEQGELTIGCFQLKEGSAKTREFKAIEGEGQLKAIMTKKGPLLLRESESQKKEDTIFYGWPIGISFQDLTEKEANEFIMKQQQNKLGQVLGELDGKQIIKKSGKFGDYIQWGETSIPYKEESLEDLQGRLKEKQENKSYVKKFKEYEIRQGQYGPYIMKIGLKAPKFVSIPKDVNIENITEKDVEGLYKVGLESKKDYNSKNVKNIKKK